ncbi:beta-lactamase hydrolase domain-containing protein, partial [Sphingomonas sp.]|uniref:beta-lactamase hydrolase domain-containing protein n=1 Tax=Sphingomonas sp. TaxID=28214 RepID=UPI00286C1AD8
MATRCSRPSRPTRICTRRPPMLRVLDDKTLVSGQIMPADVAEFQRQGVTMIVNNRPDFEDEDQPLS